MTDYNFPSSELSSNFYSLKRRKTVADLDQLSENPSSPTTIECIEQNTADENDPNKGLPLQPYYPTHFLKGTQLNVGQPLEDGEAATELTTKKVELMEAIDFFNSAARLTNNHTDLSKLKIKLGVVKSLHLKCFRKILQIEVASGSSLGKLQCPVEYPLFCTSDSKGWTSFDPKKTLSLYALECKQLEVEDTLIFLADYGE